MSSQKIANMISSRDVAKEQKKDHHQILKIVRALIASGEVQNARPSTFFNSQNKQQYEEFFLVEVDYLMVISRIDRKTASHTYKRKEIAITARKKVFERDAYRCKGCGDWHDLCVDHILPVARGGCKDIDNLQTLCRPCNSKKGTKTMEEWLEVCNASN